MTQRFKALAILSLACIGLAFFADMLLDWYLRRDDDNLQKQIKMMLPVSDDQPSRPEVKVSLPEDLLSILGTPGRFRVMRRVSDIPSSVKIAFAEATSKSSQEDVFSMAEPGSWPWSVGDGLLDRLPRRRLRAVAASESLCLVFYEHGGFAKSDDVAAFRLSSNGARAVWHLSLAPDVATPAELLNAVRAQPYGDERY
jgi:hypothetical protein